MVKMEVRVLYTSSPISRETRKRGWHLEQEGPKKMFQNVWNPFATNSKTLSFESEQSNACPSPSLHGTARSPFQRTVVFLGFLLGVPCKIGEMHPPSCNSSICRPVPATSSR